MAIGAVVPECVACLRARMYWGASARCKQWGVVVGYQKQMQIGGSCLVKEPAFVVPVDLSCAAGRYVINMGHHHDVGCSPLVDIWKTCCPDV